MPTPNNERGLSNGGYHQGASCTATGRYRGDTKTTRRDYRKY